MSAEEQMTFHGIQNPEAVWDTLNNMLQATSISKERQKHIERVQRAFQLQAEDEENGIMRDMTETNERDDDGSDEEGGGGRR
jgi:hypothetical protein